MKHILNKSIKYQALLVSRFCRQKWKKKKNKEKKERKKKLQNSHKHSSLPFRWSITVFKEDQTIFVKNTGKNQPVRVFIGVAVYFQNHTFYTHTTIKNLFTKPPIFQQLALFSTKNSSLWEANGHRLHFCALVEQSIRSLVRFKTCPLFLPSSQLSRSKALKASDLWSTALLPSKLNSHWKNSK